VSAGPKRILAVASGGGHWVQLLRLRPAFEGHDVVFVTVNPTYRTDVPGERFHVVADATRWNPVRLVWMALQVLWLLVRYRPRVVISSGAAPGYMGLRLGKMLGARTVWMDSIANVERVSLSGEKIARHADLMLTQWPHLARDGGPRYEGAVI
jgi:UDP-N-acetylglucosamine:LPS N-acetylglucosamine transferase